MDTETRIVVPELRGGWRVGEIDEGTHMVQTSSYKVTEV